jgi:hypothetical protein
MRSHELVLDKGTSDGATWAQEAGHERDRQFMRFVQGLIGQRKFPAGAVLDKRCNRKPMLLAIFYT